MSRTAAVVLAALLAMGAAPARAQELPARTPPAGGEEETRYFDYFVSRLRPADGSGPEAGAVGGRLMWALPSVVGAGWPEPLHRAAVGAFLVHAPGDGRGPERLRYGAQADLPLVERPLGGVVEPVLSVAVGAVRVQGGGGAGADPGVPALLARPSWLPPRVEHALSVAPGLGARVRLLPGLDLRADARRVADFAADGVRRQLELSAGLSVRRGARLP